MKALEVLRRIASGETTCGRCRKGEWEPGKRQLKMKEAVLMARNAEIQLNAAINEFNESQPKPWDWERFVNKEP